MIYYNDDKIIIRDIKECDVVNLFQCDIDKEINRYDPRPMPNTSRELAASCIDYCKMFDNEILNKKVDDREYKYFIITDSDEKFIGFVNFFDINKVKKQGEMGVIIGDKRYWHKEIAYIAVKAAVNYIFNNMDIDRIYIETTETNIPSKGLFNKLGFKLCGDVVDEDVKFLIMEKRKASF